MPIAQQLLLDIPSFLLAILVVGGSVLFSVSGLVVVRIFVHHDRLKRHHEVADPLLGALAGVYAVLLALVVVSVWQNFETAKRNIQQEANYLADVYRYAEALSPDFRQTAADLLHQYRQAVVEDEWKTMAKGKASIQTEHLMRKLWTLYASYVPENITRQSFFDLSLQKLTECRDLRRQRLMDATTGIHSLLWLVLIVGAVSLVTFTFLFGVEDLKAQIFMGILFSMTIALILFTCLALDYPFTGSVSLSPEPFRQIALNDLAAF